MSTTSITSGFPTSTTPRTGIRARRLRLFEEKGWPQDIIDAVAGHATFLEVPRETQMAKTLFAVDELSGFVAACALVRPTGIEGMAPKSVKKKLKQPSFAAGVNRDEVRQGAEELGVDFDEHVQFVIDAMAARSDELGLGPKESLAREAPLEGPPGTPRPARCPACVNTVTTQSQTKEAETTVEGGQILELSTGDVQVTDSGEADGQPIVLLHGYANSLHWFDAIEPLLAENHRVIRIDLLGFGGSEKPESGYSIPEQASLVAEAL